MRVSLDRICITRGNFSLAADGTFDKGVHLVSGAVGSGKSTLALCIAGMLPPDRGTIQRSGIGSTMLSLQFPEHHVTGMTAAEECTSWGCEPDTILASCGLKGHNKTSPLALSRGELKRLHLACVLNNPNDLLLLDEPFSSLDCEEKYAFCTLIAHHTSNITIIFTHEQSVLPRFDRIWEIENGILHDRGTPPEALKTWNSLPPLIKKLIAAGKSPRNISQKDILEAACRT